MTALAIRSSFQKL